LPSFLKAILVAEIGANLGSNFFSRLLLAEIGAFLTSDFSGRRTCRNEVAAVTRRLIEGLSTAPTIVGVAKAFEDKSAIDRARG
jgi:hypothetical protein